MIAFLNGILAGKTKEVALVNVGGMGYEVFMSESDLAMLPEVGDSVMIYTYLQVREDAMLLFGFLSNDRKACFLKLIGVSGVGPKVALAALSVYSPEQLGNAIAAQDVSRVSKIPGVGKKTASRMILELKDSFAASADVGLFAMDNSSSFVLDGTIGGVAEALLSMGFTQKEAELALKDAPRDASESALIQYALKRLGAAAAEADL